MSPYLGYPTISDLEIPKLHIPIGLLSKQDLLIAMENPQNIKIRTLSLSLFLSTLTVLFYQSSTLFLYFSPNLCIDRIEGSNLVETSKGDLKIKEKGILETLTLLGEIKTFGKFFPNFYCDSCGYELKVEFALLNYGQSEFFTPLLENPGSAPALRLCFDDRYLKGPM